MDHDPLCGPLRRRLAGDPGAAFRLWCERFGLGLRMEAVLCFDRAEREARCALELAAIMLGHVCRDESGSVLRFTHSALLLIRVTRARGEVSRAGERASRAVETLRQAELPEGLEYAVSNSCHRLRHALGPVLVSDRDLAGVSDVG